MATNRFLFVFILILVYEILMMLIHPFGLSFTKVAITMLVWSAFSLTFSTFVFNYPSIKSNIPAFAFYVSFCINVLELY